MWEHYQLRSNPNKERTAFSVKKDTLRRKGTESELENKLEIT